MRERLRERDAVSTRPHNVRHENSIVILLFSLLLLLVVVLC